MTTAYGSRTQNAPDGITIMGEAVRRASPEGAEFLIEITASAPTAAQALHDNQVKTAQVTQAVSPLGVDKADVQTISLDIYSVYAPVLPAIAAYGGVPQIGAFAGGTAMQPEAQSALYLARNTLRISARDPRRLGEIADTATRAGATVVGPLSLRVSDEAGARKAALEAAVRDARAKAEAMAAAVGKQVGDAITITEDLVASNGVYTALRSAAPFAFGAGAPQVAGGLEYYARVSATFRLQ